MDRFAVVVVVLVLTALFSARPRTTVRSDCSYSSWADPRFLDSLQLQGVLQHGEIAVRGSVGFVVGNDLQNVGATPTYPQRLVAATLEGREIGTPSGNFLFGYPQPALDERRRLHVVWGEPGERGESLVGNWATGSWVRSLWHATYDPSRGSWSEPRRVYRSAGLLGWHAQRASVAIDAEGHVQVSVPHDLGTGPLIHLVITDSAVTVSEMTDQRALYAHLVVSGRNEYVGFTAWDRGGKGAPMANVYVMRSLDGGASWSTPTLVPASVEGSAHEVQVVAVSLDTVLVFWAVNPQGGLRPERIRSAVSGDNGQSWQTSAEVAVPNPFTGLRAVRDECGEVHVAFRPWPEGLGRGRFGLVRWTASGWTAPVILFPELTPFYVELAPDHEGGIYLFATALKKSDPPRGFGKPMLSVRRPVQ